MSHHRKSEERGPAAVDAREFGIETAIGLLRTQAFSQVSIESVAAAAGLRRDEVAKEFPVWDDLLKAVITEWNGRRTGPLIPIAQKSGAVAFLRAIVRANEADPALMRFLVATVNIASMPDQPLSSWLRDRWEQFYDIVRKALTNDIEVGREPSTMQPARGAEQLIALYEGLQTQSMIRRDMDVVEAFDRAIARLRSGWSDAYTPAVFEV